MPNEDGLNRFTTSYSCHWKIIQNYNTALSKGIRLRCADQDLKAWDQCMLLLRAGKEEREK